MNKRILLAGVLAGIALFAWEFVAHMLTPLGQMGMKALSDEPKALAALTATVPESGFYFFPAPEFKPGMTMSQKNEAMNAAMAKSADGPTGLLLFHNNGARLMFPRQMTIQFAADLAVMLLAAFLLAQMSTAAGFLSRLIPVVMLGFFSVLRVYVPLWNWYHYPKKYIAAQICVDLAGFLIGGLVLAKMVQSRSRTMAAAS